MPLSLHRLIIVAGLIAPGLAADESVKAPDITAEPLQIIRTMEVSFPAKLLQQNIDAGEASIMVMVGADGQLLDWLVTGFSHALFAMEVLEVLPKWKFIPAYHRGTAIPTRVELKFFFKNSAFIRILPSDTGLIARHKLDGSMGGFTSFVCLPDELDQPLDAKVEIAPMPPDQLGAKAKGGQVVVEYLVDTEGKVRMPIIISAEEEAFANSVLLAISQWRYEIPRHQGLPVITRVRHQFTFTPVSR